MNFHAKNILKAIRFETPDYIPMSFVVNPSCWHHYPQDRLFDLMEAHPLLFPDFRRPTEKVVPHFHPIATKGNPYTDNFGCVWETTDNGIMGTVVSHPLKTWDDFKAYPAPNPQKCMGIGPIHWADEEKRINLLHQHGQFVRAGLRHGHTFLQLCDIRGYENIIFDMMDEEKNLPALIDMVEQFNASIVKRYVDMGIHLMSYAEDLGMQSGPMITRALFQKYIKPSYSRLMKPALEKDIIVHMHSDGDIRELSDDLIDSGVQVINLQDLVNGIDWIAKKYSGKICIELDIDRQNITTFGTPMQIDALIFEEVKKIGTPQGGLMMIYGLYPNVPLENIAALMDAMEKYAFYYN